MRTLLLACLAAAFATAAQAQTLTVNGTFGYLGEYAFSSRVAARNSDDELSGTATIKHVGVCAHAGPDAVEAPISLRPAGWLSGISGTLVYNGQTCSYRGTMSKTRAGELVCPTATVPFYIWSD